MTQRDVLDYWFGKAPENRGEFWFGGDEETDLEIRERFGELYREAEARDLDHWAHTASGRLALIILLDQFSRNIHRDDPRAYDNDSRAQWLVEDGVHAGMDRELGPYQRAFFYMPLMHAENRTAQNHSVELFTHLAAEYPEECAGFVKHAEQHRDVVARFGRFPHRNELLGRETTDAEAEMLKRGRFG